MRPAIAIPTETKKSFECPDSQLVALDNSIAEADRILVVGWRGAEQHFLGKLKNLPAMGTPVLVVTGQSRSKPRRPPRALATVGLDQGSMGSFTKGFSGFLANQDPEQFLSTSVGTI